MPFHYCKRPLAHTSQALIIQLIVFQYEPLDYVYTPTLCYIPLSIFHCTLIAIYFRFKLQRTLRFVEISMVGMRLCVEQFCFSFICLHKSRTKFRSTWFLVGTSKLQSLSKEMDSIVLTAELTLF